MMGINFFFVGYSGSSSPNTVCGCSSFFFSCFTSSFSVSVLVDEGSEDVSLISDLDSFFSMSGSIMLLAVFTRSRFGFSAASMITGQCVYRRYEEVRRLVGRKAASYIAPNGNVYLARDQLSRRAGVKRVRPASTRSGAERRNHYNCRLTRVKHPSQEIIESESIKGRNETPLPTTRMRKQSGFKPRLRKAGKTAKAVGPKGHN